MMKLKNRLAFSTASRSRFSLCSVAVELGFDTGQLRRTGTEIEILELGPQDAIHEVPAVHHRLVDSLARILWFGQSQGRHALGIEVDEERPSVLKGQAGGKIDGGRRLADPAFLVGYGDDLIHRQAQFHVKQGLSGRPFSSGSRGKGRDSGRPQALCPGSSWLRPESPVVSSRASRRPLWSIQRPSGNPGPSGFSSNRPPGLGDLPLLLLDVAFIFRFGFDVSRFLVAQGTRKLPIF